jgi:NAD(P)-dependent dehydrogenase (short-subunit alcohol dehydrogenase family)
MGRSIALTLAREGAYVVCADLRQEASPNGFEEDKHIPTHTVISNSGGTSRFQKCDMGKPEEVYDLVEFTIKVDNQCPRICPGTNKH